MALSTECIFSIAFFNCQSCLLVIKWISRVALLWKIFRQYVHSCSCDVIFAKDLYDFWRFRLLALWRSWPLMMLLFGSSTILSGRSGIAIKKKEKKIFRIKLHSGLDYRSFWVRSNQVWKFQPRPCPFAKGFDWASNFSWSKPLCQSDIRTLPYPLKQFAVVL